MMLVNDDVFCSFCGKSRQDSACVVGVPGAYICNVCWGSAGLLIAEAKGVTFDVLVDNVKAWAALEDAAAACLTDEIVEIGAKPVGSKA